MHNEAHDVTFPTQTKNHRKIQTESTKNTKKRINIQILHETEGCEAPPTDNGLAWT